VIADVAFSYLRADVKSPAPEKPCVCKGSGELVSRRRDTNFSDLASSLLKVNRLDDGSEGVIEVAAVVVPMSRVLMVADLDCEATGSSQSPDTRIARSVTSCLVSLSEVIVESSFDDN